RLQVLDQRVHHNGVVVAVVERTGAGEEVEVFVAVLIPLLRTQGTGEGGRPGPAVAANGGFAGFEDIGLVRRGVRGTFGHHWSPFDFLIVRLPLGQSLRRWPLPLNADGRFRLLTPGAVLPCCRGARGAGVGLVTGVRSRRGIPCRGHPGTSPE